jgi:hypothetical protein
MNGGLLSSSGMGPRGVPHKQIEEEKKRKNYRRECTGSALAPM